MELHLHSAHWMVGEMRIAKPMLLISTPLGMIGGVYEAFRLAGGLALLMIALMAMIAAAVAMLVLTIRREQRASESARELASAPARAPAAGNAAGSVEEERRQ